jgi:hypothetical protein
MNTFTKLLFNFIFVYSLFFFKLPDIENDNYIQHKLLIFMSLFAFNYILNVITKIRNECVLNQSELASKSLRDAVTGVIGYSLYIDLNIMDWSKGYFNSMYDSKYTLYLIATLVIVFFMSLIKILILMFDSTNPECIKH